MSVANREIVLKDILNAVQPCDLIPVNFKVEGNNAHFMARNCGPAIEQLCRQNLVVKSSNDKCVRDFCVKYCLFKHFDRFYMIGYRCNKKQILVFSS